MQLEEDGSVKGAEERLAMYYKKLSEYTKVEDPDKVRLGKVIRRARGKRSVRGFAEKLKVSPATISKVENGKATGISLELLANIASHADRDSGVTLDELLEADGIDRVERME